MKKKYRIRLKYKGDDLYNIQYSYWYWPFWRNIWWYFPTGDEWLKETANSKEDPRDRFPTIDSVREFMDEEDKKEQSFMDKAKKGHPFKVKEF